MSKKYCCAKCGGTEIQIRAWVDPNGNKYIESIDDNECWCLDCDNFTELKEIKNEAN